MIALCSDFAERLTLDGTNGSTEAQIVCWFSFVQELPRLWTLDAWWIRKDLMEETGVTEEDLTTIEGMEEALRKFAQCKDEMGSLSFPYHSSRDQDRRELYFRPSGLIPRQESAECLLL